MLTFRGEAKDIENERLRAMKGYGRPKFWRRVIFAVLSQSAKSAKVMRLENTALYGISLGPRPSRDSRTKEGLGTLVDFLGTPAQIT